MIEQLEVLREMRDTRNDLTPAQYSALTDVIAHFDACIACLEKDNARTDEEA